jgi:hypothetical protein
MIDHYRGMVEADRLTRSMHGRLELRVQEILRRTIPSNANIPDVGGATGILPLLELGTNGGLTAANESDVDEVIREGRYNGHAAFVDTHFHTADELREELEGFRVEVFGVEGPAWPTLDATNNPDHLDSALRAARLVETDPHLIHASAHLLARAWLT